MRLDFTGHGASAGTWEYGNYAQEVYLCYLFVCLYVYVFVCFMFLFVCVCGCIVVSYDI